MDHTVLETRFSADQLQRVLEVERCGQKPCEIDIEQCRAQLGGNGGSSGALVVAARALRMEPQRLAGVPVAAGQRRQPTSGRGLQRGLVRARDRPPQPAGPGKTLVEAGFTEQCREHLGFQVQALGEERRVGRGADGQKVNQAVSPQRRVGGEVDAAPHFRRERAAQQVERQIDRRPPFLDVVLQIGVEPLVAQVEVGGGGDQHEGDVEIVEPAVAHERRERAGHRHRLGAGGDIASGQQGLARRLPEQASDLGCGDVKASKRVAARRRLARTCGGGERLANQAVQPGQRLAEVERGAREFRPDERGRRRPLIRMRQVKRLQGTSHGNPEAMASLQVTRFLTSRGSQSRRPKSAATIRCRGSTSGSLRQSRSVAMEVPVEFVQRPLAGLEFDSAAPIQGQDHHVFPVGPVRQLSYHRTARIRSGGFSCRGSAIAARRRPSRRRSSTSAPAVLAVRGTPPRDGPGGPPARAGGVRPSRCR